VGRSIATLFPLVWLVFFSDHFFISSFQNLVKLKNDQIYKKRSRKCSDFKKKSNLESDQYLKNVQVFLRKINLTNVRFKKCSNFKKIKYK
jgi:hypothetical protein